jgi:hypothetical protein
MARLPPVALALLETCAMWTAPIEVCHCLQCDSESDTVTGSARCTTSTQQVQLGVSRFDAASVSNATFKLALHFLGSAPRCAGICDYDTGICNCFNGFYGHNCTLKSVLARQN